MRNHLSFFLIIACFTQNIYTDSFIYNSFNNHGVIGLINMPSARFYDEASHGITLYNGTPDQKITMTSFPYDWMEASFFYTNIQGKSYCRDSFDPVCKQDYKDKGFNFKFRVKEEGLWPAIAVGINDIAGTGYYSSEYIVGSYGINNTDFHFGLGWGLLNGSKNSFKNPLGYLYDGFYDRPLTYADEGGQFQPGRYFSDKTTSPFFGISHIVNDKLLLKLEYDTTLTPGKINYAEPKRNISFGFNYNLNKNFTIGFSSERGNFNSVSFIYKNNAKKSQTKFQKKKTKKNDSNYDILIKNIENNGIGVNKIIEKNNIIGLELTQFSHPNLDIIEEIIDFSVNEAGIDKKVETDLKIANLNAVSGISSDLKNNGNTIYKKELKRGLNSRTFLNLRPYLASREDFFKGALLIENNSEYIFSESLFFSTNIKYSIVDNFDDLILPPKDTYPEQVRSDVKDYLRSFDNGIIIGRAQFDYHITPFENNHLIFTAGILEEMFNGFGLEYLYFDNNKDYAIGFDLFKVRKRDYSMRLGMQDYENITSSINYYYRNYNIVPFDLKISYGEYLAGDEGFTIDFSRSFINGTKFGVFASFTDVSTEDFGEGSFDKGIYFNIPIYGNLINYTWRPLTKDPGAKLIRKHTLHDLLIKFKPYNY